MKNISLHVFYNALRVGRYPIGIPIIFWRLSQTKIPSRIRTWPLRKLCLAGPVNKTKICWGSGFVQPRETNEYRNAHFRAKITRQPFAMGRAFHWSSYSPEQTESQWPAGLRDPHYSVTHVSVMTVGRQLLDVLCHPFPFPLPRPSRPPFVCYIEGKRGPIWMVHGRNIYHDCT